MWKYLSVTIDSEIPMFKLPTFDNKDLTAILDSYGNEGWELVSVTPVSFTGMGRTTNLILFFKRPK